MTFLGELRLFPFGITPNGWSPCDGALVPINQNQALFSLLGTTYGGDGRTTFALPDLRGRVPVHVGPGFVLGEVAGAATHVLSITELPVHTHQLSGTGSPATSTNPNGQLLAESPARPYTSASGTHDAVALAADSLGEVGGGQGHENRQPFLVLRWCIARQGIFPSPT